MGVAAEYGKWPRPVGVAAFFIAAGRAVLQGSLYISLFAAADKAKAP